MDQNRAELILSRMRSMDVETKLNGINEAKEMYRNLFHPDLDDVGWSHRVYVLLQCYNIVRDELQVKMISQKAGFVEAPIEEKKSTTKPKKPAKPKLDPSALIAEFLKTTQGGPSGNS